ncbi:MAG: FAD-binding oxidoreductase [Phenylobacterium sp.]|nr:FAD-binding oxidoreductase [Phenylobacterium sp.]
MSPREQAADVVIIGAGIVGASAALFLRKRGRSVILLESGLVGQQASGANFGNVRRQGRPLAQLPLANRASPIWRSLKELLGEDVEYLEAGHMRVCYRERPEIADGFVDYARAAAETGLELEVLSGNALRQRFPFLGPEVIAGSFSARDGHANPRLVAPAFGRAAARAGAAVFENTRVASVEKVGEDFQVRAEDGRVFRAPAVLVTAGAWADAFAAQFGEPVPLTTRGPTMSVTEPAPYAIAPSIGVSTPLEVESVYFRQIPRGNVIIGGSTRNPVCPEIRRAYVEPANTLTQLQQIQRLAPALARLNIIRVWTGIESYLPDDLPVMGPSGAVSGLFYAFGFCGSGFQTGPAVGDVMAELIDTGATDTPIGLYAIDRFLEAEAA